METPCNTMGVFSPNPCAKLLLEYVSCAPLGSATKIKIHQKVHFELIGITNA